MSRLSKDQQSSQQQPLTSTNRTIEESNCDSGRVSSSETSEEVKSENAVNPINNEIEILEDKIDHVELTDTPTTGTKNITRYGDIRERHTNLLFGGPTPTSSVNRVLFTSSNNSEETTATTTSDDLNNPDDFDGVEPIKSNSCKSNELSEEEEKGLLPTVSENDVEKSPDTDDANNSGGLKPPSEPGLKKVASAAKMELTGVPVVENDPLGALSNSTSPTSSMPKSATANSKF